jgi:hypothetical protein
MKLMKLGLSSLRRPCVHIVILFAVLVSVGGEVHAGQACQAIPPTPAALYRGLELGKKTYDQLEASGASVALVARAGQDLSRYHLRYSHMAFVVRDHPAGRWTLVHELNHCGTPESTLFEQGLGNFFLEDPFEYRALILIPPVETQRRLAALLQGPLPIRMHEVRYNVVAFPFSTKYQNSNQWLLELMAAALAGDTDSAVSEAMPVDDRSSAQAWLKSSGYRPTTLEIPALTRLGADLFKANVAFDDHPFDRRMAGQIDAVTVESIVAFLKAQHATQEIRVVTLDPERIALPRPAVPRAPVVPATGGD